MLLIKFGHYSGSDILGKSRNNQKLDWVERTEGFLRRDDNSVDYKGRGKCQERTK